MFSFLLFSVWSEVVFIFGINFLYFLEGGFGLSEDVDDDGFGKFSSFRVCVYVEINERFQAIEKGFHPYRRDRDRGSSPFQVCRTAISSSTRDRWMH